MADAEERAALAVTLMLTDPIVSTWLLKIWDPARDAPLAIEGFINGNLTSRPGAASLNATYLRMSPPGDLKRRCSALLSTTEIAEIQKIMEWRAGQYGRPLTETVDELPPDVRARTATPRIIRGILELISEDRLTFEEIRQMGALDIGRWTVEMA